MCHSCRRLLLDSLPATRVMRQAYLDGHRHAAHQKIRTLRLEPLTKPFRIVGRTVNSLFYTMHDPSDDGKLTHRLVDKQGCMAVVLMLTVVSILLELNTV